MSNTLTREEVREIVQEETAELRAELEREREARREAERENDDLRECVDALEDELEKRDARMDALSKKGQNNRDRIAELQSLEMEKGHHLRADHVDPERLDVSTDQIERFDGDDGVDYVREPGSSDPLERSGSSSLATGDLLPIQQLARMDDDMLAESTRDRPSYIAARVWAERGKKGRSALWSKGSGGVDQYVDASDVRVFIKSNLERDDETLSYDYAKRLAGEAMERIREMCKSRCYVEKRNHRKDGLRYKERRLVVPSDADIPGESGQSAPVKDGLTG